MKQSSLRRTTLLSLVGLSAQQSSSWGDPFTVANSALPIAASSASAASSTETLLPRPTTPASLIVSKSAGGLQTDSVTPTPAITGSLSNAPYVPGVHTRASRDSTFDASGVESTGGVVVSTAGAVAKRGDVEGYREMGFAGVVAGAAGILFV